MAKTVYELFQSVAETEPPKKREVEAIKFYLPTLLALVVALGDFLKSVTVVAEHGDTVRLAVPRSIFDTLKRAVSALKKPIS